MSVRPRLTAMPHQLLAREDEERRKQPQGPEQRMCDACHTAQACFGFGSFKDRDGFWACSDPDCRKACQIASQDPRAAEALMSRRRGEAA